MLRSRLLAGVALAALCLPIAALSPGMPFAASPAQAQTASVSFQLFFDQLQPHGVWVRHARYQYVFCPTGVDTSWRPYTEGRWLYVEGRGWYFASDEPFAWATYHYGRWFADRDLGWCWVPGTKWAPAWVSWRRSENIIGWAPLPPEEDGYAISVVVRERDLPEGYWVFVPTERFIEPDLSISIVIGSQQPDYYAQTQFLGPVTVEGDVVVNNVIDVTYIEQTINQQVIVYQPQQAASPAEQSVAIEAQTISFFEGDIAATEAQAAPPEAIDEGDAPQAIEEAGGTVGATAEIAAETETENDTEAVTPVEGEAEATTPAPDATIPAEAITTEPTAQEPEVQPTEDAPSVSDDATDQPAAPAPVAEESPCPPESMVDGQCPITEGAQPTAPAEQQKPEAKEADPTAESAAQPENPAAPADEAAPAPNAAPAGQSTQAPADEVAPAEQAAPAPETAPQDELPCPPEVRVDGKCPPSAQ